MTIQFPERLQRARCYYEVHANVFEKTAPRRLCKGKFW